MTRSQSTASRARVESAVQTSAQTDTRFCALECRDTDGNLRKAKKNGRLCAVCEARIERQSKHSVAWRTLRRAVVRSWAEGLDYLIARGRKHQ
jgi:hypothetical protein